MSSQVAFTSRETEERWIRAMSQRYITDLNFHPCVFQVPQTLKNSKPEAYTPQVVGLGPYHHFRQEVQLMENRKRAAVKDYTKINELRDFIKLADEMPQKLYDSHILACYDRYIDFGRKTWSWILIVDGIFLLDFIKKYIEKRDQNPNHDLERLVPDIMMLENQLPLKLLHEIQEILLPHITGAAQMKLDDDVMRDNFEQFCSEISPLKLAEEEERKKEAFQNHLLHIMYKSIVNNCMIEKPPSPSSTTTSTEEDPPERAPFVCSLGYFANQTVSMVGTVLQQAAQMVDSGINQARSSGLYVPNNIEKVSAILQQLKKTSNFSDKRNKNDKVLEEKIDVPTVSQLQLITRITFEPTDGGIKDIGIDPERNVLRLPVITLCEYSETILRNLVAYEAAIVKSGSRFLIAEYLDLMCGIIDTIEDVKLLKKAGIIKVRNEKLSHEKIARMFNGINKSAASPHDESEVQKVVQKINEDFEKRRIVKAVRCIKRATDCLRTWFTKLFPILVLLLLLLQYICQVRGCSSGRLAYTAVPNSSLQEGLSLGLDSQAMLLMPRKILRHLN